MKRVYLDWGVVSNLKKPEYAGIKEFLLSNTRNEIPNKVGGDAPKGLGNQSFKLLKVGGNAPE